LSEILEQNVLELHDSFSQLRGNQCQ
jgi:hypothetical protein